MIFASNNEGKIKEIKEILKTEKIESLKDKKIKIEINEDGKTFYENALKKAKAIYEKTKEAVLADDSGLIVTELKTWPGVYTNRFLGKDKTDREKNLAIIDMVNKKCRNRRAEVVCVLVYFDGENVITGEGEIKGNITTSPKGNNGFGFDEIFEYNNKTLAELSSTEKNQLSARKKAAEDLKEKLEKVRTCPK